MILNNKGFSIIEVLISIVILSVGILAASGMQISAIQGNAGSSELNGAVALASNQLETILAAGWGAAGSPIDTDADGQAGLGHNTAATADGSVQNGRYLLLWNIANPTATTQWVNVIVTWPGILGFPRQVNLFGMRTEKGST